MENIKNRKIETEIFSRISGYFRPLKNWNKAKQEEFRQRKNLKFNLEPEKPISFEV